MTRSIFAHDAAVHAARETHANSEAIRDLHGATPQAPPALAGWLGRLTLLYGVPFHYLTPDDRMLPKESIRFFTVDWNWMAALIDGATSIGRIVTSDLNHDRAFFAGDDGIFVQAQAAAGISAEIVTGFLLRSALVEGWWPGIKIDGFPTTARKPDPDTRLKILRLDRLSPSVLLCLFDGQVQRVNIHEPPEGLHFGLDKPDDEYDTTPFYRQLRSPDGTLSSEPIKLAESWTDSEGCLRLDEEGQPTRTLKVEKLAGKLASHSVSGRAPFTAAEFALAMVEGVDLVGFGHETANSAISEGQSEETHE